jgi:hypothetical protein
MNRRRHAWLDLDRFRSWIPAVTLLFTLGHFANLVHFACVGHRFCVEHQQLEHVSECQVSRAPGSQSDRSVDGHPSAPRVTRGDGNSGGAADPLCSHQHDSCGQATVARSFTTIELPARPVSIARTITRLVALPAPEARGPALPILRVAPKTSPPT